MDILANCITQIKSYPLSLSPFYRLNGSMPANSEVKNNTIFFKGPVTYDLAGTYVCDATNSIGTRSGRVEVNVTGKFSSACLPTSPTSHAVLGGGEMSDHQSALHHLAFGRPGKCEAEAN